MFVQSIVLGAGGARSSPSVVGSASKPRAEDFAAGTRWEGRDPSTTLDARARGRTKLSSPGHFPEDPGLSPACSYHVPNASSLFTHHTGSLTHWSPPFNVASRKDHSTPPHPSTSLQVPFCSSPALWLWEIILFIPFPFDLLSPPSIRLKFP